jgi:hypothetical protein
MPATEIEVLEADRWDQQTWRDESGPDYRTDLDLVFAVPEGGYLKPDSVTAKV